MCGAMYVQPSSCVFGLHPGKLDDTMLLVEHRAVGAATLQPVNANGKVIQGVTPFAYQLFSYRAILHRKPLSTLQRKGTTPTLDNAVYSAMLA